MEVSYELSNRGNESFPFEYYYLDETHVRYVMPYHWHMDYELVRVSQGNLTLYVGNMRIDLAEGDCVMVPPGAIHGSLVPAGIYECVVFDISKLFIEGSSNLKALRSFWDRRNECPVVVRRGSAQSGNIDTFFEVMRNTEHSSERRLITATGTLLSVFGHFFDDGITIASTHKEKTERIKKVIIYIRKNYDTNISLDDLASEVGLNREYLCREFKAATGLSPINFLIEYRVEQSKKMLLSPRGSVTEAALSSGFSDISYYIKKFSSLNGCTPLQYRHARVK